MKKNPVFNFYNSLHSEKIEEWPSEDIIRFHKKYVNGKAKRIVDLGCGAGRHCFYFGALGHEVWGIDISSTGIKKAKEINQVYKLPLQFRVGNIKKLPYPGNFFDYAICWATIFYQNKSDVERSLIEINRCLQKGAYFLFTLKHPQDSRNKHGQKVAHNTYVDNQGLTMYFTDYPEIKNLISRHFTLCGLESFVRKNYNTSQTIANWVITVQKK
ncbi:class I SAM-dependent methyltransferase [Candidatus Microgenomates bacterium]|nr:MAG: class I SAM-dependent methyltransferase [Candidatus Microgenomates bacterium]